MKVGSLLSTFIATCNADESFSLLQHRVSQHFAANTSGSCVGHTELKLSTVTGTIDTGLRYASVTDGVDLVVKPLGEHKSAADSGMVSDFGIVNVLTGSSTEVEMRFVEAGSDNPTVLENIAFSLYDMDEGKAGKGRVSMQLCGPIDAAFPANSELAVHESEGCYHISSCLRGAKGNEPASVAAVDNAAAVRTATFWFERAARLSFKMEVTPGWGGRNFMFAFEPSNACQPNYQPDFVPQSCCPPADAESEDCDNAVIDFTPPEPLPIETTTTTTTTQKPEPGKPPAPPPPFCKAKCPKGKRCCFAKNGKRTVYLKKNDGKYRDKCLRDGKTWCCDNGKKLTKPVSKPKPEPFCKLKKCKKGVRYCFKRKNGKWAQVGKWPKATNGKKKSQCVNAGGRYCDPNGEMFAKR